VLISRTFVYYGRDGPAAPVSIKQAQAYRSNFAEPELARLHEFVRREMVSGGAIRGPAARVAGPRQLVEMYDTQLKTQYTILIHFFLLFLLLLFPSFSSSTAAMASSAAAATTGSDAPTATTAAPAVAAATTSAATAAAATTTAASTAAATTTAATSAAQAAGHARPGAAASWRRTHAADESRRRRRRCAPPSKRPAQTDDDPKAKRQQQKAIVPQDMADCYRLGMPQHCSDCKWGTRSSWGRRRSTSAVENARPRPEARRSRSPASTRSGRFTVASDPSQRQPSTGGPFYQRVPGKAPPVRLGPRLRSARRLLAPAARGAEELPHAAALTGPPAQQLDEHLRPLGLTVCNSDGLIEGAKLPRLLQHQGHDTLLADSNRVFGQ
jgi:hypothetical protein